MMEDNEEEEDDDNYVPPEYGDAVTGKLKMLQRGKLKIKRKLKIQRNQTMCPMMISAGSLLMQGKSAKVKRRS